MAKKKIIIEEADSEVSTSVAVITPAFEPLAPFKLLSLEDSLKIINDKGEEYAKLTIVDTKDTDGYKKVVAARGEMKKSRTAYINAAYENFIDPIKKNLKEYEADLLKIENAFKAVEKPLQEKQDFIDNEKVRIKAEEEAAKVKQMQVRVNDLNVLGAMFDGALYTFGYDDALLITAVNVKDFSDAEFGEFLEDVKTAWTVEQDRIKAEQEESLRLQQEQEEQAALQLEQAKQINAQAATLNEKQRNLRIKELKLMGAVQQDDDTYLFPDKPEFHLAPLSALMDMDDAAWDELMYDIEHFVPATDPLVKDGAATTQDTFNLDSHFNQHVDPEILGDYIDVAVGTELKYERTIPDAVVNLLTFTKDAPYTDFDISSKIFMRVYPDEFEKEAINGLSLANEGRLQGVNWCLIKK